MKQLIKKSKIFVILILAISFIGCEDDDDNLPVVTAGFTHTISQTGVVRFINTSTNADNYSWDFGDESTSTEINPIKIYSPGVYTIILTASNVAGASDTYEDTIMILDSEIPLITLIGDATINLTLGDTFTDPGATAFDEVDGDLTADIIVGGDVVDTSVEGTYVITYDVTDAQGNEAIQVTRTVNVSAIVCTPETSESIAAATLNITFQTNTPAVFEDNTTFTWIDNPDPGGPVNTSCKVGQVIRANNSPYDNIQIDLVDKLDFNTSEGIKMKVWSPVPNTPVLLKLEEIGNGGNFVEVLATTSIVNGWEELTYDFPATATPQFNKMVIFFNFNVADGSTYYFDDLMVYGGGTGGGCVPETTESIAANTLNITFQSNTPAVIEDNTTFTWIDNPDFNGSINTSCKVGEVIRANNSPYDNIQIDLADKFDFNTSEGLKMKVWSPVPNTPVLLKLEEIGNGGNFVELLTTTSVVNSWEELTFDFAATATPQFNKIVIFFNFNVADGSTYYFDDLMVYGSGNGGGNCPAPPAGEFILDGDFEANANCWGLFDNGGTTTISTTVSNGGGTNSGQIQTATGANPGLKQERFGVGTIQPNTTYVVTFDIKADAANPLVDGAVFQVFTFSEPADGSGLSATQHVLIAGDANLATAWTPRSYTFTTAGNVDGGVSLLFELVCGGATTCGGTINIDNVSLTAQ
ncbi:immunoglobulin-like domain-containing protein [Lacinutrix sp. Hel_I_90]|uniref:immunoglobulin-like domain-containing protein n=1 Tax=Lacinutrix sp. Hel_I_90 TaxID=1249999 RepID=UPI0005C9A362|nr:immunoglobulin-like domain-containing protein [Lacinutrix sp. Hel_I_90]